MGFRGVLLRMAEGDTGSGGSVFRVVAPDAELALPAPHQRPRQENALTASASDVVVVTDHVSARLLQVAGCTGVLLQRETHSALWVAALASQKAATLVDTASRTAALQQLSSQSRTSPSVSGRGLALNAWDHSTLRGNGSERRSCYCFQFRSRIEYELFERTVEALRRIQHMALLENSVLLELELEREREQQQLRMAESSSSSSSAAIDKRSAKSAKATGKDARTAPKPLASRTQGTATSRSVQRSRPTSASGSAREQQRSDDAVRSSSQTCETACILCGASAPPKTPFTKHPFVLQDARGAECHICSLCMHGVLSRRIKHQPAGSLASGARDIVCGLCAQSAATLKACALAQCHRVYCTACLGKLVGKAQSHKVLRTKHWHCPNCTNYNDGDDDAAASSRTDGRASQSSASTKSSADATRKRKRHVEPPAAAPVNGTSPPSPITTTNPLASEMAPVDYAANYFAFLLEREWAKAPPDESEDVCFCCKDGGDLIECDWPGSELHYARCPKVYHEDCLGYKVPENFEWKCPRHRCQACGIIAMYSCRFCVTSYCSEHVPSDILHLGPATRDIPESTYVICRTCEQHAQRALSESKLSTKTHAQLRRLPPKRK